MLGGLVEGSEVDAAVGGGSMVAHVPILLLFGSCKSEACEYRFAMGGIDGWRLGIRWNQLSSNQII